jgi:hypothetical protein
MKSSHPLLRAAGFAVLIAFAATPGIAQQLTGAPAASQYKYSTPMPPGVASPETVETRFGALHFFDGRPGPGQHREDL